MHHDTDPNLHPSITELEPSAEQSAELSVVSMSPDQFAAFNSADPEGDETTAFMAANQLKFDSRIIILVDGEAPAVFNTSPADWLTRDRRATAELIARGLSDSAEIEAAPIDRALESEMGHAAFELTTIDGGEDLDTTALAEEPTVEGREAADPRFNEIIGQIEDDVHNRVQFYQRRTGEELELFIARSEQNALELQSMENNLLRMNRGLADTRDTSSIEAALQNVRGMLRRDLTGLGEIGMDTTTHAQRMTDLVEGELPAQKKRLSGAGETSDDSKSASEQADKLEAYLRQTVGVLGVIGSTVNGSEHVVRDQLDDLQLLIRMTEDMQQDIQSRRADQESIARFGRIITQFVDKFNHTNMSHFATIRRAAGDLQF